MFQRREVPHAYRNRRRMIDKFTASPKSGERGDIEMENVDVEAVATEANNSPPKYQAQANPIQMVFLIFQFKIFKIFFKFLDFLIIK